MIRCTLELLKGGNEDDTELLGVIEISNNLFTSINSDGKRATYDVRLYKKRKTKFWKTKVRDFPRLSYHPWNTVRIALNQIAEKNGGRI